MTERLCALLPARAQVYPCGHSFCEACSDHIVHCQVHPVCPMCRSKVSVNQIFRVVVSSRAGPEKVGVQEINPPEGLEILSIKVSSSSCPYFIVCGVVSELALPSWRLRLAF